MNVVAFASEFDKENTPYNAEWVTDCTEDEMLQACVHFLVVSSIFM